MKNFQPIIPRGINGIIRGFLMWDSDPQSLGQDMIEVSFPDTGFLVCAGWVPEGNPRGCYEITVTHGISLCEPVMLASTFTEAQIRLTEVVRRVAIGKLNWRTSAASSSYECDTQHA